MPRVARALLAALDQLRARRAAVLQRPGAAVGGGSGAGKGSGSAGEPTGRKSAKGASGGRDTYINITRRPLPNCLTA